MNNKYALYSERMWMVISIGALLVAIYMVATEGPSAWGYFVGFGLAVVMFGFRRFLRKRFEKTR